MKHFSVQSRFIYHIFRAMVKIISANVNGIRSATQKGFIDYLGRAGRYVCVQELKAPEPDMKPEMKNPHRHVRRVALRRKARLQRRGDFQQNARPTMCKSAWALKNSTAQGRFVRADFGRFERDFALPAQRHQRARAEDLKYRFLQCVLPPMLNEMKAEGRDIVVCGDWNIAHQNIDLKNWKGNQKNSGLSAEERAWIGKVIAELGWTDMWRRILQNPTRLHLVEQPRSGLCPKTWAGASITKWSRPVWPPKPWPRMCIKKNFPTTRLWWWNMIIGFE